ncbi:hypothetical protein VTH82DRAFT_5964 [Thermothelomyces myriococcoides]
MGLACKPTSAILMLCLVALRGITWVRGFLGGPQPQHLLTHWSSSKQQAGSPSKGSASPGRDPTIENVVSTGRHHLSP